MVNLKSKNKMRGIPSLVSLLEMKWYHIFEVF